MNDPIPANPPEQRSTILAWLGGSLAAAILVRLVLWMIYSPVHYSDTSSYRRLAESVLEGFAHYDGTRTPGYPAFLALVGPDTRVWVVQMALGGVVSLILFYLGWRISGRSWFGALLAVVHSINLGQLFFEANLLTETLTTFLLTAAFAGVYILLRQVSRPPWGVSAAIGLAVSLALLTRPLFIYLPVWVGLFIVLGATTSGVNHRGCAWKTRLGRLVSFSLPVLLLVGGWALFIHQRFGDWGLTTMTGYHLVQHTGSYFEYVPDEYAALRDTYIQYRDAKIEATGTQTNAIWDAIPELCRVSRLNFYQLSRTLTRISIQLIREHPDLFLENVAEGWWMFWRAPVYWSATALRAPKLVEVIDALVAIGRTLLISVNAIFVIGSLLWAAVCYLPARLIDRLPAMFHRLRDAFRLGDGPSRFALSNHHFMLFLASSIWITSILQSLLDHGDNPRFLLPLQSVVVVWVAWFMLKIWIPRKIDQ
jgi:hypothetical protein